MAKLRGFQSASEMEALAKKDKERQDIVRLMAREMVRKRLNLPAPNDLRRGLGDEAARWGFPPEAFREVVGDMVEGIFKETLEAIRKP